MICLFHFQERLSFKIVMHSIKRFKIKKCCLQCKKNIYLFETGQTRNTKSKRNHESTTEYEIHF